MLLTLEFCQLRGQLFQLSSLFQFMQEAQNTSSWFNIHDVVLCWPQKKAVQKAGELGWVFWQNPMPVAQYQRQQLTAVAAACGLSRTAIHQHILVKEEQHENSFWYGNKIENCGLTSFFTLSIKLLKWACHSIYLKLITSCMTSNCKVLKEDTTMKKISWIIIPQGNKKAQEKWSPYTRESMWKQARGNKKTWLIITLTKH